LNYGRASAGELYGGSF